MCSIYAPNKLQNRLEFLVITRKFSNDQKTIHLNVIICGDMNTVLDRDDRSAKGSDTGTLMLLVRFFCFVDPTDGSSSL